jgi:hypothetical protein
MYKNKFFNNVETTIRMHISPRTYTFPYKCIWSLRYVLSTPVTELLSIGAAPVLVPSLNITSMKGLRNPSANKENSVASNVHNIYRTSFPL